MLALTDRANIMSAMPPRQVQWQSQLLLAQGEAMVASHLDSAMGFYLISEKDLTNLIDA